MDDKFSIEESKHLKKASIIPYLVCALVIAIGGLFINLGILVVHDETKNGGFFMAFVGIMLIGYSYSIYCLTTDLILKRYEQKNYKIYKKLCNDVFPKREHLSIYGEDLTVLFFMGIIVALFGWIGENVAKLITTGIIDSRFHLFPFISPYAIIVFLMQMVVGDPNSFTFFGKKLFKDKTKKSVILSNLFTAFVMCVFVFVLEFLLGNSFELFFGVELWNYTKMPLHATKYAGLIPSLGYGLGAFLVYKLLYKPILKLVKKINNDIIFKVDLTLGVLIVLDTIFMIFQILVVKQAPVYWEIHF